MGEKRASRINLIKSWGKGEVIGGTTGEHCVNILDPGIQHITSKYQKYYQKEGRRLQEAGQLVTSARSTWL